MKMIASALVQAQKNFAPALKKADNPYFGSKYADLAACIEAVIDSLNNSGIALIQHTSEHDKGVVVSTVFLHESGEIYEAGAIFVPSAQNTAQAFGSALTYARRYSLMAACGIAPEDDDGNAASRQPAKFEKAKTTIGEDDVWTTGKPIPSNDDMWATSSGDFASSANISADAPYCDHGLMVLKEGKKDGNPYRGYVCKENIKECARWMIKSKTTGEWRFKDGE